MIYWLESDFSLNRALLKVLELLRNDTQHLGPGLGINRIRRVVSLAFSRTPILGKHDIFKFRFGFSCKRLTDRSTTTDSTWIDYRTAIHLDVYPSLSLPTRLIGLYCSARKVHV